MAAKCVIVELKNDPEVLGKLGATLPDNRRMLDGVQYAISLDEFAKLTRKVRESVLEPVIIKDGTDFVIPLFDGTNYWYALDQTSSASLPDITYTDSEGNSRTKTFQLGEVVQGFEGDAFKLVSAVDNAVAGDVLVWVDETAHTVAKANSPTQLTFAGVSIGAVTGTQYAWIQIAGNTANANIGAATAGDAVAVDVATDGAFKVATSTDVVVGTVISSAANEIVALRDSGVVNRHIKRGKLFYEK